MSAQVKVLNYQHTTTMLPDGIVVTIDSVSEVLYIRFAQAPVKYTKEDKEGILIDFGARGNVIGMSILHPKKVSVQRRKIMARLATKHAIPGLAAIRPEHFASSYAPDNRAYAYH